VLSWAISTALLSEIWIWNVRILDLKHIFHLTHESAVVRRRFARARSKVFLDYESTHIRVCVEKPTDVSARAHHVGPLGSHGRR